MSYIVYKPSELPYAYGALGALAAVLNHFMNSLHYLRAL
jgi:hypothetical protein